MSIFVSKYKNYTVGLTRGYSEVINGHKVVHKPVKAKFRKYMFDSNNKHIPLKEEEIIKTLRKNKFYGKDFWEKDHEPINIRDLLNTGIRDLKAVVDEVDDMGLLQRALLKEEAKGEEMRKMAVSMFRARIKQLLGDES